MKGQRVSAGLLMYRRNGAQIELFLAHPGGPMFVRKDEGHWTIPKGEICPGEQPLAAAMREFEEEVGMKPSGDFIPLGSIQQKGGKIVHAWGFEGDWPEGKEHRCTTFSLEWPPRSGRMQEFPEIDRVCFFAVSEARRKLKPTQHPFIDRLLQSLDERRTA